MDAFVLGAVPPYSGLLGGKLVAMLALSDRVRRDFHARYASRKALISGRRHDARLALVTTTSALGRSSVYNRLRVPENDGWHGRLHAGADPLDEPCRLAMAPIGWTKGSGDFHLSGPLYDRLVQFLRERIPPEESYRHDRWNGNAYRNRREVITRALDLLGLDGRKVRHHGYSRQVFAAELARNARPLLRGEHRRPLWQTLSIAETALWWRLRYAQPRAARDGRWRQFEREHWRLWGERQS